MARRVQLVFRIGTRVQISDCSGVDSGKKASVIRDFNWEEEQGAYGPPTDNQVPIQFDSGRKRYMWASRLERI